MLDHNSINSFRLFLKALQDEMMDCSDQTSYNGEVEGFSEEK